MPNINLIPDAVSALTDDDKILGVIGGVARLIPLPLLRDYLVTQETGTPAILVSTNADYVEQNFEAWVTLGVITAGFILAGGGTVSAEMDFSSVTSMLNVASVIQTAFDGALFVSYSTTTQLFTIRTVLTGASVSLATPADSEFHIMLGMDEISATGED